MLVAAVEREASLTAEKEQLGAELEVAGGQVAEGRVVAAQAEEAPVLEDQVCVCVCRRLFCTHSSQSTHGTTIQDRG